MVVELKIVVMLVGIVLTGKRHEGISWGAGKWSENWMMVVEVQIVGAVLDRKGHEGIFWGIGNILYLDWDSVYVDVYLCRHY